MDLVDRIDLVQVSPNTDIVDELWPVDDFYLSVIRSMGKWPQAPFSPLKYDRPFETIDLIERIYVVQVSSDTDVAVVSDGRLQLPNVPVTCSSQVVASIL